MNGANGRAITQISAVQDQKARLKTKDRSRFRKINPLLAPADDAQMPFGLIEFVPGLA